MLRLVAVIGASECYLSLATILPAVMNKASALSVLANPVLVWNTIRIAEFVEVVEATSGRLGACEDVSSGHHRERKRLDPVCQDGQIGTQCANAS